jgi:hypothetical protein
MTVIANRIHQTTSRRGQSFSEYCGLAKESGTELLDHADKTKNIDANLHQIPFKLRWSF